MAATQKKKSGAKHASAARNSAPAPKKRPTESTKKAPRMSAAEKKRQIEQQELHRKAKNQMRAVILFLSAIFLIFLIFIPGKSVWYALHAFLLGMFGYCAILWPILLLYIAILLSQEKAPHSLSSKIWQCAVYISLISAAIYIFKASEDAVPFFATLKTAFLDGATRHGSGLISALLGVPMVALLGSIGAKITILIILIGFTMLLTGTGLLQLFRAITHPATAVVKNVESRYEQRITEQQERLERQRNVNIDIPLDDDTPQELPQHPVRAENAKLDRLKKAFCIPDPDDTPAVTTVPDSSLEKNAPPEPIAPPVTEEPVNFLEAQLPPEEADAKEYKPDVTFAQMKEQPVQKQPDPETVPVEIKITPTEPEQTLYTCLPPIELLEPSIPTDAIASEMEKNSTGELLVNTLKSFGVQTKILDISQGPAVTRYELQPLAGVKISKITSLADDIALNLAASGVRIEAPIPNKAAVGIEVPNKTVSTVKMRELIDSNAFATAKSHLTVALGRDIAGNITLTDLAKMPHLLIAGATGSGKSVCINSLIISLLYKSTPDSVRFLMIDPKVVELGIYNGIPHLLVPVVTDPRKAAGALNWAVSEMLNRYKLFAEANVRDLKSYNESIEEWNRRADSPEKDPKNPDGIHQNPLPQIVIIIDELADLMMAAPSEVEDSICRLAQMARAAGMYLVIATQRPSVDVITGIIKANIPSRIAFAVSSQIDSRTILDMGGAEKLLGRGDMLFAPAGSPKPTRIQGCFVSDKEIERVVTHVKHFKDADYDTAIAEEIERQAAADKDADKEVDEDSAEDPMMNEAIKCVVEAGQASTSLLQRRLKLGYARAGRLIDQMEQKGVVGPYMGSKPRQVLLNYQQYLEMMATTTPNDQT